MSLKQRLVEQITLEGPMTVADYMTLCLHDPKDGYYSTRPAIGAEGDFITAPLISQMFGEMIGVWVAQTWQALGAPVAFRLVEIGGGDGTLMSDILRVARQVPGLREAARVVMVEPSALLRNVQAERLPDAECVSDFMALGDDLPLIVIANEVLDCLPARQVVKTPEGWCERVIGLDPSRELCFGLNPQPVAFPADMNGPTHIDSQDGAIHEFSLAQHMFTLTLAGKLRAARGVALLIDYGRSEPGPGDTLQALSRHEKHDPLEAPGRHDLTVWADFPLVAATAERASLGVAPLLTQATFLHALGIDARRNALITKNPAFADKLERQYARLMAPDQMGELFKVLTIGYPATLPQLSPNPSNP